MLVQVEIVRVSHFPVKVYKDYRILTNLRELKIAPEPLFRSSHEEEKVVGTAFIVMSYVEVSHQGSQMLRSNYAFTKVQCSWCTNAYQCPGHYLECVTSGSFMLVTHLV